MGKRRFKRLRRKPFNAVVTPLPEEAGLEVIDHAPEDFAPIVDPVGEWIANQSRNVEQQNTVVEVPQGSPVDEMFRRVAAKDFGALSAAEEEQLREVAKALLPPAKRGAKKQRKTLETIQVIAWLIVHEPNLKGHALAARLSKLGLGLAASALRDFRKDHQSAIQIAIKHLRQRTPRPPAGRLSNWQEYLKHLKSNP
jgi:hypothetical protein